nr:monovalent cation/H(+) antiporter subunit G [Homoserinimonas aerilata]
MDMILDVAASVCLILGAAFSLAAGIGLIRFPDALSRMHAATKPQVLGLILVLLAIALSERSWAVLLTLAPILLFQMLTAPVSAHMIGRAAYRAGNVDERYLFTDELDEAIDRAQDQREKEERELSEREQRGRDD